MLIGFCCSQLLDASQGGSALGHAAPGYGSLLLEGAIDAEVGIVALAGTAIAGHELALAIGQAGYGCLVSVIFVGAEPSLQGVMSKGRASL